MPGLIGNLIVLLALSGAVALAVRSLWRSRKAGNGCNGNCAGCGHCRGKS